MFDINIHYVGNFKNAEKNDYITTSCQIGLVISGFRYIKIGQNQTDVDTTSPFLCISPQGTRFAFEANNQRNNWAVLFDTRLIRTAEIVKNSIEIYYENQWLVLPMLIPVITEHISGWEGEFIRMYNAFRSPTPINKFRCELGIYNIFRYFIDKKPDSFFASPADKLKWLIDQDVEIKYTIEELSAQCGHTPDHIRILFQNQYGMLPVFYRNKMRMAYAMSLISNSNLSIKEISSKIGFKHVSHFARMFKIYFRITPLEGIRKFRNFQTIK